MALWLQSLWLAFVKASGASVGVYRASLKGVQEVGSLLWKILWIGVGINLFGSGGGLVLGSRLGECPIAPVSRQSSFTLYVVLHDFSRDKQHFCMIELSLLWQSGIICASTIWDIDALKAERSSIRVSSDSGCRWRTLR